MQKSGAAILAVFALTAVLAGAAVGQTTGGLDLPRTFEGRPDFSGAWTSRSLTMTERAEPGPLVVDDETAAKVAQGIYDFIRSDELAVDIDPDAIAADVGASLLVVANALRLLDAKGSTLVRSAEAKSNMDALVAGSLTHGH